MSFNWRTTREWRFCGSGLVLGASAADFGETEGVGELTDVHFLDLEALAVLQSGVSSEHGIVGLTGFIFEVSVIADGFPDFTAGKIDESSVVQGVFSTENRGSVLGHVLECHFT